MDRYLIVVHKGKEPIFDEFKKIAKREGKSMAQVLHDLVEEHVKKHGEGNPTYTMEKFLQNPTFKAFPTIGETPSADWVKKMDKQDLQQFIDNSGGWYRLAVMHRDRKL